MMVSMDWFMGKTTGNLKNHGKIDGFPVKIFAEQFSPNARLMALDPPIVIACVAANSNQSVDINPLLWGFS